MKIPEIRPISDLARDAKGVVARARERQEPVVITQRGRDVAVVVPIELYRQLERQASYKIASPRLARPQDAGQFRMTMTVLDHPEGNSSAGL